MNDFETGANEMEVAEPSIDETVEETGAEDAEFAEQQSTEEGVEEEHVQTPEENSAFAQMRRDKEQAQAEAESARRELAELRAIQEARAEAEARLTGSEDARIQALAEATGMSEEEVRAEIESAEENARKDLRIEQLEQQVNSIEADKIMQADLMDIQKIDPTITSLRDLGDDYPAYIEAGLSATQAYWAIKGEEYANKATPPKPAGEIKTTATEKDYFTDAEIEAMSSEQLEKNWKKIIASWDRRAGK